VDRSHGSPLLLLPPPVPFRRWPPDDAHASPRDRMYAHTLDLEAATSSVPRRKMAVLGLP
jgi:hypothetical protein